MFTLRLNSWSLQFTAGVLIVLPFGIMVCFDLSSYYAYATRHLKLNQNPSLLLLREI